MCLWLGDGGGGFWGWRGAGVKKFLYYEFKFKTKKMIFLEGAWEGRLVILFFTKNPNLKKNIFFLGGGGGGNTWTDRRTGPTQFAPSTSSMFGA